MGKLREIKPAPLLSAEQRKDVSLRLNEIVTALETGELLALAGVWIDGRGVPTLYRSNVECGGIPVLGGLRLLERDVLDLVMGDVEYEE